MLLHLVTKNSKGVGIISKQNIFREAKGVDEILRFFLKFSIA